jgi:hypothetical protein
MRDHEYALLGAMNRAQVGRYLGLIAAAVSAGIRGAHAERAFACRWAAY